MSSDNKEFIPLNIVILTVSDTRSEADDSSGDYLVEALQKEGHTLAERKILKDNKYALRAAVSNWILDSNIHVVISTGGTGFTPRDTTPEALSPLFDKTVDGFGELFRQLSYNMIGTSTVQSRCIAGIANDTLIACLPGSTGACKDAWKGILKEQLDNRFQPCSFVPHLTGKYSHK
jgi:molybdenum cofactor biosynthesis protein B